MSDVDHAELERYLRIYQENPDSRVFAPLADLYRRLGRLNEAEEICREGIRRHPYYAGGRVALAHVLLDQENFEESREEAHSVVTFYPDNLLARKILVRVLAALDRKTEAQKELAALRQMAPAIASDPELEAAINSKHSKTISFPSKPGGGKFVEADLPKQQREISNPDQMNRLKALVRKKLILERLILGLGREERIS